MLLHVVLSGPERRAAEVVGALRNAGIPADVDDDRSGFPADDGVTFVECLAPSVEAVQDALVFNPAHPTGAWRKVSLERGDPGAGELVRAGEFGYQIRLHGLTHLESVEQAEQVRSALAAGIPPGGHVESAAAHWKSVERLMAEPGETG